MLLMEANLHGHTPSCMQWSESSARYLWSSSGKASTLESTKLLPVSGATLLPLE